MNPNASPALISKTSTVPATAGGIDVWVRDLNEWFDTEFRVVDGAADSETSVDDVSFVSRSEASFDVDAWLPLPRESGAAVHRAIESRKPQVVRADLMSSLLVVPLAEAGEPARAAVAEVVTSDDRNLLRSAELYLAKVRAERRTATAEAEAVQLSQQMAATYEEITLIHRLTQHLSISQKPTLLGLQSLEWLIEVVPACGLAVYFDSSFDEDLYSRDSLTGPSFLMHGKVPIGADKFLDLLTQLDAHQATKPIVVNHGLVDVRQLIVVPIVDGDRRFGWLAAFNHVEDGGEFGTIEANLLSSVGTILGIHGGNIDLYSQQSDLFAGTVRAMSSAIDAKDPYTRGHSDRVARIAVRLAEKLGCDEATLRTIYLGGLLHDVGKIGIDDGVLRKPGKLTDAEYEHIKTHVEIGYRILRGLRKMGHLLPIVLHHHEAWDGKGYPFGLSGENIPWLARIVAVADAYDAMSSDRPYRKGMELEKLDSIFRDGAGRQWDPKVIEAYFAVRDEIRDISHRELDPIDSVTIDWTH